MTSEISAMYCSALCYNVKGILPYAYEAWTYQSGSNSMNAGKGGIYHAGGDAVLNNYSFGVTDFDINDPNMYGRLKRQLDFYGENKWDSVCILFAKIKTFF